MKHGFLFCFSPDGRHLFVALRYHGMEILDAGTGETVTALKVGGIAPNKKWHIPSGFFAGRQVFGDDRFRR